MLRREPESREESARERTRTDAAHTEKHTRGKIQNTPQ